jgi:hypothetical protein
VFEKARSFQLDRTSHSRVDIAAAAGTLPGDHKYEFLLHDRHATFFAHFGSEVERWGIQVLRSPVRTPAANAHCERLIGTIRWECLDYRTISLLSTSALTANSSRVDRRINLSVQESRTELKDSSQVCDLPSRLREGSRAIAKPVPECLPSRVPLGCRCLSPQHYVFMDHSGFSLGGEYLLMRKSAPAGRFHAGDSLLLTKPEEYTIGSDEGRCFELLTVAHLR